MSFLIFFLMEYRYWFKTPLLFRVWEWCNTNNLTYFTHSNISNLIVILGGWRQVDDDEIHRCFSPKQLCDPMHKNDLSFSSPISCGVQCVINTTCHISNPLCDGLSKTNWHFGTILLCLVLAALQEQHKCGLVKAACCSSNLAEVY